MQEVAKSVFEKTAPEFANKLMVIVEFLIENPELAPRPATGDSFGSATYWERLAGKFVRGRNPRAPLEPSTVPDTMVSLILQEYFGLEASTLPRVVKEHSLSMAAENIVGDLLERYIASKVEAFDWVWCSGEVVKKVDFLTVTKSKVKQWIPLQIKNRDNSENSSSSSVRDGTEIVKWFRTFSRTGETNWGAFPGGIENVSLSEQDFDEFARKYLRDLRT